MSKSFFPEERARRIQALHKQIMDVPEGVVRSRLVAAFSLKWGLRASTVQGYLDVLEDAGLVVTEGDVVKPVAEEAQG